MLIFSKRKMDISNNQKIFISGTGRCGTTFLMIIFTYLKLDTGFTIENFKERIFQPCNSGLEFGNEISFVPPYKYVKKPDFLNKIDILCENMNENPKLIKYMIIPIRNYEHATTSRVNIGNKCGGL